MEVAGFASRASDGEAARTIGCVISRPMILAVLSLPAAVIGYTVAVAVLSALGLPKGIEELVLLFVPLFIAGLCMVPFIAPLVDRMAKRDLAAHRAAQAAADPPPADPDAPRDSDIAQGS